MREFNLEAAYELLGFFESYAQGKTTKKEADALYQKYFPANTVLDKRIYSAVGLLLGIVIPESVWTPPTVKEAAQAIQELKGVIEELQ